MQNRQTPRLISIAAISLLLVMCILPASGLPGLNSSASPTPAPATRTPQPTETPIPSPSPYPTVSLDLNQRPLVWFAPLPPLPRNQWREYSGSQDFMALFTQDAPWTNAASHIQVFQLPGEWVASVASDVELRQVVADLNRRGLALAVETGALTPGPTCGQGLEGFDGIDTGRKIAARIQKAGGVINLLVLDKPYYFGSLYAGSQACKWEASKIASDIAQFVQAVGIASPGMVTGDTEALTGLAYEKDYQAWLDTYRQVNGVNLGFLHLEVDWSRPTWPDSVKAVQSYGQQVGVPVGIIYSGDAVDQSDAAWLTNAGERIRKYELDSGVQPAQVIFQSRNDKPDFLLPETRPGTFTALIDAYFKDKSALGIQRTGPGANLALGRPVKVSGSLSGQPGAYAVDADPNTWWSAPRGPVEWIEIDLGAPYTIQAVNLLVSQFPPGKSIHKIIVKGPGNNNTYTAVYTFTGVTADGQRLSFTPAQPLKGIQFVRIQTLLSPAWVAWREIEVIAGQ